VELLDPPRTGPVTGDVVRRRAAGPDGSLSAFHADVLPAEEAEAAGGAAGGTGGGPANVPPSEEMGGEQVPDWEAEKQQRRTNARDRNHEGELDGCRALRGYCRSSSGPTKRSFHHGRSSPKFRLPDPCPLTCTPHVICLLTMRNERARRRRLNWPIY
jgi:hypothetical protein